MLRHFILVIYTSDMFLFRLQDNILLVNEVVLHYLKNTNGVYVKVFKYMSIITAYLEVHHGSKLAPAG